MRMTSCLMGIAVAVIACGTAMAKNSGPTLRDQQQAACYDDVQRFCGSAMPDEAKVTECMKPLKAKVSEKCRAMWDVK